MNFFIQVMVNGVVLGSFIALMALGLVLIFGTLRVINFAHGEFFMLGAFTVYYATLWGAPFWVALPMAFAVAGIVGAAVGRGILERFRGSILAGAVAAIALSSLMQNAGWATVGGEHRVVALPIRSVVHIGDTTIEGYRLVVIGLTAAALGVLYLFLTQTWSGRAIRALEENPYAAELMGVRRTLTVLIGFGLGTGLAGFSGAVMAPLVEISPSMGFLPLLWGFVVVILGGTGRYVGAAIAALVVGIQESLTIAYWRSDMVVLMSFALVTVAILLRRGVRPGAE